MLSGDRLKWGLRHMPFGPRRLEEREVGILALGEWLSDGPNGFAKVL